MSELGRRMSRWLHASRWRRELREEMDLHRTLRRDDRRFGNELALIERSRSTWGWTWIESLGADVNYGLRRWRRSPVATGLAVVSLMLGIGANLALFSIMDAVMLRSLPVEHPEQLVQVMTGAPGHPYGSWTNPMWEQLRDHQQVFDGAFSWATDAFKLHTGGEQQLLQGVYVSGGFFGALGVRPVAGRLIANDDDRRGCPAMAVVSEEYAGSRYGDARAALGQDLNLDGHVFPIVGVSPADFFGMNVGLRYDVAVPMCAEAIVSARPMLDIRDAWWQFVGGRLKPGETAAAATAQLNARLPAWLEASVPPYRPDMRADFLKRQASLRPIGRGLSQLATRYGTPLEVLLAIAGLVLLVACANLAGLMLAQAEARRSEIATRLALGGSRARLIRQMLIESGMLALTGAALGAGLALWACSAMQRFWGSALGPTRLNLSLDSRLLAFALAVTAVTSLLVGLAPAVRSTRMSLAADARQAGTRRTAGGRSLAAAQVAISLLLLTGAGLFVRTFVNLTHADLGFDPEHVSIVSLLPPRTKLSDSALGDRYARVLAGLQALPGVESVSESFMTPTSGLQWDEGLFAQHSSISDTYINAISPAFFATLRTPVIEGRAFTADDRAGAAPVAIINQTAARLLFGRASALGQIVHLEDADMTAPAEIVGVVADAKYVDSLRDAPPPTAYFPLAQLKQAFPTTSFELRSALPPAAVASEARRALAAAASDAGYSLGLLSQTVAFNSKPERLLAWLSGLFGGLALLLTAIGLYGLMSQNATRRRREFGVRMALGARPASVVRLAISDVAGAICIGAAAGAFAIWLAAGWLQANVGGLLFGLKASDWTTLAGAVALLAAICALAAYLPARRAARADPMLALREE